MTTSFTKKILIKKAELDRLQQRQLRDYSPELQAIRRLLNDIRDKTASNKAIRRGADEYDLWPADSIR